MNVRILNRLSAIWMILLFMAGCNLPATEISAPASPPAPTSTATITPLPTQIPTATLAPQGEVQPIQDGYVYLGDRNEAALGFDLHAGGAIGSLLYHGTEMVDDSDFGRYIQFSPYDGTDQYLCDSSSTCFTTWGWNPLQAGSADGQPAKVLEVRRWNDGLYIRTQAEEWGRAKGASDVIYETWAWDRGGYFEVHTRLTHTGNDTHAAAGAESPAAYFGAPVPLEYGYTGPQPFTGDAIQQYQMVTGDMDKNTNPPVFPSEHWMAFGNQKGTGLILALPPQPKFTGAWSVVFIQNAYPYPIGYAAPFAHFETPPGFVFDLTYYLIPGPIAQGRSIVYDIVPHTTWTFNLNTAEGWANTGQKATVRDGVLLAELSPADSLTSAPGLNFYGVLFPTVDMRARTRAGNAEVCLEFVTLNDWDWSKAKAACAQVQPGEFGVARFDFSSNPAWTEGLVTQLRLTAAAPLGLEINEIRVNRESYGWEFNDSKDADGWAVWNQLLQLQIKDGSLASTSLGNDPYMGSPYMNMDAATFHRIQIRMRNTAGSDAQIFFITDKNPGWDEIRSKHFSIIGDGAYHIYTVDMSSVATWRDQIRQIRLDPMTVPGDFAIDYIRVEP